MPGSDFNAVEPMQVDLPPEENDNAEEEAFIVENPSLVRKLTLKTNFVGFRQIVSDSRFCFQDLEGYINNYTGMAKLLRLIHIADHCPTLRVEALKMAILHVQGTFNVAMYQQLHKKLRDALAS